MIRRGLLLAILAMPLPAAASHAWAEIDICETYKDTLPPGLTLEALPEPASAGATLLNQYCTQCHNLPGPDRHTAAEWRELAAKMFMLMDVSHRFGGLMGRVEILQPAEHAVLLDYLERHASDTKVAGKATDNGNAGGLWLARGLVLFPVLLLVIAGLVRWWRTFHKGQQSCVQD